MKKNNFIYLIVAAAVIFFSVVLLNSVKDSSVVEDYRSPFEGIAEENIREIKIWPDTQIGENDASDQEVLTLSQIDSVWRVGDYVADRELLSEFIQNITDGDVTKMISSNSDSFDLFEVGDSNGRVLEIILDGEREDDSESSQANSANIALIVGKSAPTGGNYFRYKDEGEVFVFSENLVQFLQKDLNEWRSKVIVAVEPSNVKSIKTDKLTLTKLDAGTEKFSVKSDEENASFDQEKVDRLVNNLLNLKAIEILDGTRESMLKGLKPKLTVEVNLGGEEGGENIKYQIYIKKESEIDQYYVHKEGDDVVYRIDSLVFEELNKAPDNVK